MAEIIILNVETILHLPPERVISGISKNGLKEAVVVGIDEHGEEYLASSCSSKWETLWMLERAKIALLRMDDTI